MHKGDVTFNSLDLQDLTLKTDEDNSIQFSFVCCHYENDFIHKICAKDETRSESKEKMIILQLSLSRLLSVHTDLL